ncbi:undecaprenyl-phosphate glucose phosphotransferase [bacterium]|nr:undecaprenyl-phosphate glucose phosphotransferase [bacterium]MCI0605422.1 undecaprenyl-phosphate glucose phosphotransferase [bacterium]
MVSRKSNVLQLVYLCGDLLATTAAFLLAYYLRFFADIIPVRYGIPPFQQYLNALPLLLVVWPVIFYFHGLYQVRRARSYIDEFFSVTASVGISTAIVWGILLYYRVYHQRGLEGEPALEPARVLFLYFMVLDIVGILFARGTIRRVLEEMRRRGYNIKKVLIAGAGNLGETVARKIRDHEELGYDVMGFIDDDPNKTVVAGYPVIGKCPEVSVMVDQLKIDCLILALPLKAHDTMMQILHSTRNEMVDIKIVPDILEYVAIRAGIEDLDGVPIINLSDLPLRGLNSFFKRIMDILFSGAGLLVTAALFPLIMLLVKLRSAGPIFFNQERMGLDGKFFVMYKFRTMAVDAESETGPVMSQKNDPRITSGGRFLRKFYIDEWPQFWNVLKGDMSLVGPRPERPFFVHYFKEQIPQYMLRHKVRSGITGWAQVNGWRGNTSIEKRIEHDLYYIENWSLALDLKIMWLTLVRGFSHSDL